MNDNCNFQSWESAVRWLREQPDQQELVRTAYYDDPLNEVAERYRQSSEWQAIRKYLSGHIGSALDIGAGRGIASYALAHEGFSVTALEPDPSDLVGAGAIRKLASDTRFPIEVVQEYSEQLPFREGLFDVVFARAALHHAKELNAACREFFRVLKPGGVLVAVREHVISRREDLPSFLNIHPLHKLYGGENAFLLKEYTSALDHAGFDIRTILAPFESPINYYPHTSESLRDEIVARSSLIPGSSAIIRRLLSIKPLFFLTLRLLSAVDSRPGRLYSFFCNKPFDNEWRKRI